MGLIADKTVATLVHRRGGDHLPDEQLERLGNYFVHLEINEKYGITFELFVELNKSGQWENFVN